MFMRYLYPYIYLKYYTNVRTFAVCRTLGILAYHINTTLSILICMISYRIDIIMQMLLAFVNWLPHGDRSGWRSCV